MFSFIDKTYHIGVRPLVVENRERTVFIWKCIQHFLNYSLNCRFTALSCFYNSRKEISESLIQSSRAYVGAGGILFENGYAKLKDFGFIEGSAIDSAIGGYGYSSNDSSLIAGGNFISIGEGNSVMQLKISIDSNVMCVRGRDFNGEWGAWRTVSLK